MDDKILNEIFADLAADLVDLSDDQIKDRILTYGLDPADMKDVYDTVKQVQEAEAEAAKNQDPLSLENVDALADANTKQAQQMANEDNTEVTVTEEDKDNDGDTDKVTVTKEDNQTDLDPAFKEWAEQHISEGKTAEDDNSSESDDKPQLSETNKTNQFARTLSELR